MCSNVKHVGPTAILILVLCVLSTNQSLFSRKKPTTTPAPENSVDHATGSIPHKETSHWWQFKHRPSSPSVAETTHTDASAGPPGTPQVVMTVPLLHQKLQSFFESHLHSDLKWVPCFCQVRKSEYFQPQHRPQQPQHSQQQQPPHHLQQQQQPQQLQPQQQQPQPQQPQPQQPELQEQLQPEYGSSYYPATQTSDDIIDNVPRIYFAANYPIEA